MIMDDQQFATVEHCPDVGARRRVVINWTTPDSAPDKPDDQDVFKHTPRATIDTGSSAARIVGITADRVAVLVSDPEPAVVVYDTAGQEVGRTPVDVSAQSIVDADRLTDAGGTAPTPAVRDGQLRFSVVGDSLLAVSSQSATVTRPRPHHRPVTWPGPRSHPPPGCWRPSCQGPSRAPSPSRSRTCRWPGPGTVCWGYPR